MIRRLPLLSLVIVVAAAATMVWLGLWQLDRARWKEALIEQYARAEHAPPVAWPSAASGALFRKASGKCLDPRFDRTAAGQNADGEAGYAFIVDCRSGGSVAIGWSKNPAATVQWAGGPVSGTIGPDSKSGTRLIANRAAPGLEPLKPPSLDSIPNNHRLYAIQWFAFAALSLIVYGLALRSRWRQGR